MTADRRTGPTEGAGRNRPGRDTSKNTPLTLWTDEPAPRPWTADLWELEDARSKGQAAALAAASQSWRQDAEAALSDLAASGRVFTAEDLRRVAGDAPGPSQNSFGALFAAASRAGMIEAVGITTASRDVAAGHVLRQWRGARHA